MVAAEYASETLTARKIYTSRDARKDERRIAVVGGVKVRALKRDASKAKRPSGPQREKRDSLIVVFQGNIPTLRQQTSHLHLNCESVRLDLQLSPEHDVLFGFDNDIVVALADDSPLSSHQLPELTDRSWMWMRPVHLQVLSFLKAFIRREVNIRSAYFSNSHPQATPSPTISKFMRVQF